MYVLSLCLFPQSLILARGAALITCIHPGFITYAGMVATETMFLVFLLIFFILFLPHLMSPLFNIYTKAITSRLFFAGIALGITALIRPGGHYLVILSCVMLLAFSHGSYFVRCKKCVWMFGGWLIVVAPWLLRNFIVTGALLFHSLPGLHFLQYSAAYIIMERDNCSYGDARPYLMKQLDSALQQCKVQVQRPLNDYEKCCCAQQLAMNYITQYPWYFLKTAVIQMAKTCCSLYAAQPLMTDADHWPTYTRTTSLWVKAKRFLFPEVAHRCLIPFIYYEIFFSLFLLIGLLACLLCMWTKQAVKSIALRVAPYVILFVGITLAYGCARLRMPNEPFIIIFSSEGWLWLYGRWSKKKNFF
jgi:hypothetical protein